MKLRAVALLSLTVLLGLGAILVACGGGEDKEEGGEKPAATQPAAAGETRFEVEQDDFYFDPEELKVKAGVPVGIELKNEGKASHTFTIDELGVDQVVQADESATVKFTPDQDGTLTFYCRFHRGQGMEGELTVSGSSSAGPTSGANTPTGSSQGYSDGY